MQSPPRRSPNTATVIILGFGLGVACEVVVDLFLDFVGFLHPGFTAHAVAVVSALFIGLVVGGAMFLGRPHQYGVMALAGASAVISAILGDQIATPVYFAIKGYPIDARLFTDYFTHAPRNPIFWIANVLSFAFAAGLTALRVRQVSAAKEGPAGMPSPPWAPPRPGPWGQQPRPPYANGPYDQPGPYNQQPAPGNPPAPYGPPPQPPYGPPQPPYGQPPQGPPPS